MFNASDLPAFVAIHADPEDSAAIITTVSPSIFSDDVQGILAGEGIWGAYRAESGFITVQTRDGEEIWTEIQISDDGYVFA